MVDEGLRRCKRFIEGLRSRIHTLVMVSEWDKFPKLVKAALRAEENMRKEVVEEEEKELLTREKRVRSEKYTSRVLKNKSFESRVEPRVSVSIGLRVPGLCKKPWCEGCGRYHTG